MASRRGDGSGKPRAPHVHHDDLRERYLDTYVRWIGAEEVPVPEAQEDDDSVTYVERSQTNLCTGLALWHYNANNAEFLTNADGIDSHRFSMKWVHSENDVDKCIHLNFKGRVGGRSRTFFAELVGPAYPGLLVTKCVEYGPADSMHNCEFCSGLWHPMEGGFHGHQKVKLRHKRRAQ